MDQAKILQVIKNKDFELLGEMLHAREIEDLNTLLPNGETLLTFAAQHGDAVDIEVILNFGADPLVRNKDGISPVNVAMKAGNHKNYKAITAALLPVDAKKSIDADNFEKMFPESVRSLAGIYDIKDLVDAIKKVPGKDILKAVSDLTAMGFFDNSGNLSQHRLHNFAFGLSDLAYYKAAIDGDDDCVRYFSEGNVYKGKGYNSGRYISELLDVECKRPDLVVDQINLHNLISYHEKLTKDQVTKVLSRNQSKETYWVTVSFLERMQKENIDISAYLKSTRLEGREFIKADMALLEHYKHILEIESNMLYQMDSNVSDEDYVNNAKEVFTRMRALGLNLNDENEYFGESGELRTNVLFTVAHNSRICDKSLIELVTQDVDINAKFRGNRTILDIALGGIGYVGILPKAIRPLIELGATCSVNPVTKLADSLEYVASQNDDAYLFPSLPIDITDADGKTILMVAAKRRDIHLTERLIRNGANPHLKDNKGRNALTYCFSAEDDWYRAKVVEMIVAAMDTPRADMNPEPLPEFHIKAGRQTKRPRM